MDYRENRENKKNRENKENWRNWELRSDQQKVLNPSMSAKLEDPSVSA